MGPKKKTKAQKEAERLQAEEDERKAEILRAKREAERVRKQAEDAKRLKEKQAGCGQAINRLPYRATSRALELRLSKDDSLKTENHTQFYVVAYGYVGDSSTGCSSWSDASTRIAVDSATGILARPFFTVPPAFAVRVPPM